MEYSNYRDATIVDEHVLISEHLRVFEDGFLVCYPEHPSATRWFFVLHEDSSFSTPVQTDVCEQLVSRGVIVPSMDMDYYEFCAQVAVGTLQRCTYRLANNKRVN